MKNQVFHLLPEHADGESDANTTPTSLPLPAGPSQLVLSGDGRPQVTPLEEGEPARGVVLEPWVNHHRQARLLMINLQDQPLRVNTRQVKSLAILQEKDAIDCQGGLTFHVTLKQYPQIGAPPAEKVGTECPVCRVPFQADTVAYTCPCGAVIHCEEDREDGLECTKVRSDCPGCRRPFSETMKAGFTYLPDWLPGKEETHDPSGE